MSYYLGINNNSEVIEVLIQFRVKNFASFKNEAILDLRAVSYKDMKSHLIEVGKNKVVKTLGIYGANASGKSNLVSALYFFESFVFNQFYNEGTRDDDIDSNNRMLNIRHSLYRLSSESDSVQEFEIIFYQMNNTYQYGFSMECDKNSNKYSILEEWLLANDKPVFDRKTGYITAGTQYSSELKSITKVRNDRLYIGILDYFSEGNVKKHIDNIKEYLRVNFNVHFELYIESTVKGFAGYFYEWKRMYDNSEYRKKVEAFIKAADINIKELKISKSTSEDGRVMYRVKTIHSVYDPDGNIVGEEAFDIEDESSGTIRYMVFIQNFLNVINNGGVFIVDELTARLHPILAKFIVDLYQDENNKKAQLIFTTHDVSLLNRNQFRRDEVAFIDKSPYGESSIYTLADIKARPDASFSKEYLNGKYGAVPLVNESDEFRRRIGESIWGD